MAKPSIIAVDDDHEVLRAVERDLKTHYGADYRVLRCNSGPEALDVINQLAQRGDPLAMIIADQRMPEMTGVELLTQAFRIDPYVKRVLLTAYSDTDAAIRAINDARLDYYLIKPWDPPEEKLYPVLDDLLQDWKANYTPEFDGIKVIGHRWSFESHEVKNFLARNQIPYKWHDIEVSAEGRKVVEGFAPRIPCLPLVIFEDGQMLEDPAQGDLVEKLGLRTHAEEPFYDLVIVGGGPTGLAAAVYGASEGLSTLMIEGEAPGGQAGTSSRIENYLGFPSGLSGADLARRAVMQAQRFGVEILTPQTVVDLHPQENYRHLVLADGSEVTCHAVLIATGVSYRKLDVPGAKEHEGAGVYYGAAITEALACKAEDVFVVGGANSAGQGAMYLSQFAHTVTILVRGDSLEKSMSAYLIEQIKETKNIVIQTCSEIVAVNGSECVQTIDIKNANTDEVTSSPASSVFIFIGAEPRTDWLGDAILRDSYGFVLTGPQLRSDDGKLPANWPLKRDPYFLETSLPGVFAAGDVRHDAIRRVAAGVGTGSMSVQLIHQYLADVR